MNIIDVVLVDAQDNPIGAGEKIFTHKLGLLHRAFSIFLFDQKGRFLLQQRNTEKYHAPSLWANACCGHPYVGEDVEKGAMRRLEEELGIKTPLTFWKTFTYCTDMGNGLIEHELVHIFKGHFDGAFHLNANEVADLRWLNYEEIQESRLKEPKQFAPWFNRYLDELPKAAFMP